MKNDDQEQLGNLLSIFTGYQVGIVLAILTGIFLVTISLLSEAVMQLMILTAVLIVPYLFVRKLNSDEPEDEL